MKKIVILSGHSSVQRALFLWTRMPHSLSGKPGQDKAPDQIKSRKAFKGPNGSITSRHSRMIPSPQSYFTRKHAKSGEARRPLNEKF
ncbi:MAG: hypothetical protein IPH20_20835 [Bacteroidales bacterium]|nr:hypothetical protein [Bacteroidales bacterium]